MSARSRVVDIEAAVATADAALAAGWADRARLALDAVVTPSSAAEPPADRTELLAIARHHLARHRIALATGTPGAVRYARSAVRLLSRAARDSDPDGAASALLAEAAVACCADASFLLRAQMIVLAQRAARAALAKNPGHGEAHAALGLLALHTPGRPEARASDARRHLAEATRLQPGRIDWRGWLARACLAAGDSAAAERELDVLRSVLAKSASDALIASIVGCTGRREATDAADAALAASANDARDSAERRGTRDLGAQLRPATEPAISVRGAVRGFAGRPVLRGVDLHVDAGEIVGLIGPNGAGKSTLLGAIAGRVALDSGSIGVLGAEVRPGRMAPGLGYAPQATGLYPLLTVREHLLCFARLHGRTGALRLRAVASALAWSGLEDRANDLSSALSGGMRRRLALAIAALHEPPALLLDEPMTGIDRPHRDRIWEMLRERAATGVAILCAAPHADDLAGRSHRLVELGDGVATTGGPDDWVSTRGSAQGFTGSPLAGVGTRSSDPVASTARAGEERAG